MDIIPAIPEPPTIQVRSLSSAGSKVAFPIGPNTSTRAALNLSLNNVSENRPPGKNLITKVGFCEQMEKLVIE